MPTDHPVDVITDLPAFLGKVQDWLGQYFFTLFEDERVAIGLSLAILVAGATVLCIVLSKVIPARLAVAKLIRAVEGSEDKEAFAADFPKIGEVMASVRYVKHGWAEFVETLVFPTEDDARKVIKNTARPSDYLNLGAAEHAGLHLRFFQSVPNYFVGIGLLLTFVGLAAALFFATEGLNQQDPAVARQGLEKLLGAATFKFLTSIAGICSSIVIAFTYRFASSGLEKKFDILCDRLEERLEAITPESIAYDQFRELKKQSIQLERFNTDLAFSIATELDKLLNQTLRANIAQVIEPVAKTLDKMSGRFGEMNQEALKRMLDDFQRQLQGAAGTELVNLAASLKVAAETLQDLAESMERSQQGIKDTLEVAGRSLRETAAAMRASVEGGTRDSMKLLTESIERVSSQLTNAMTAAGSSLSAELSSVGSKAAAAFTPATSAVNGLVSNIEALQEVLKQQTVSLEQLHVQLIELVGATSKAAEDLRSAGEPSHEAARKMAAATDALGKVSESIARSGSGIEDLVQKLAENRVELLKEWERYAGRFEGVDRELARTFETFEAGAQQYHSSVREFFTSIDSELQTALSSLGGGVEALNDNVLELSEVMDAHVKALREIRRNVEVTE